MEEMKHTTSDRGVFKNLKSTFKYAKSGKKILIHIFIFKYPFNHYFSGCASNYC